MASIRSELFSAEANDRYDGLIGVEESALMDHLQIAMVQSLVTDRTAQVVLLVQHLIDQDNHLIESERIFTGEARRDSKDRPDDATGMLLATSRALAKAAAFFDKQAAGRVKHAEDMKIQRKVQRARRQVEAAPVEVVEAKPKRRIIHKRGLVDA